jgi:hypothetical protein
LNSTTPASTPEAATAVTCENPGCAGRVITRCQAGEDGCTCAGWVHADSLSHFCRGESWESLARPVPVPAPEPAAPPAPAGYVVAIRMPDETGICSGVFGDPSDAEAERGFIAAAATEPGLPYAVYALIPVSQGQPGA